MQLAWSHDSKSFLVIGNGKNSSLVVYSIDTEKPDSSLRELWVLPVKNCPSTPNSRQQDPTTREARESEVSVGGSSERDYPYKNAFYMAEFNPSGNIFAVEEIPYQTSMVHLVSPAGDIVRSLDLMAGISEQESCRRRPVNTLFLSAHHDGQYAVGLERGSVVLVDAELLQINRTFNVVRNSRTICLHGYVTSAVLCCPRGVVFVRRFGTVMLWWSLPTAARWRGGAKRGRNWTSLKAVCKTT